MNVLPDVLKPGLQIVFCGTAVGNESARANAYYAGRGNQFWSVLYRAGLTPRQMEPHEFRLLPQYGIGLTDLAKRRSGSDGVLSSSDFDCDALLARIERFQPKVLAFNGKRAARAFYGHQTDYGRQSKLLGKTTIFVLPSTSGAARRYWDESFWQELADFVGAR
jgi:TDG/mug DNA glycosylase family protein